VPEPAADPLTDHRVRAAIAASHLRDLPPDVVTSLLSAARSRSLPAGHTLHRVGEGERHVELVVTGLVRVHVSAPDGRTLTVRYCRRGALMGVLSLYATSFVMPTTTQVVVNTELIAVSPAVLGALADRDVRVARALLFELSERAAAFSAEIGGAAFATVRQRVARHLLDLAAPGDQGAELMASVSQQELADAVARGGGAHAARAPPVWLDRGLIETGQRGIRIGSAERLLAEAYPGSRRRWNTSS
jgi:CRP/FNR family transcriptional regulator